jgi:hypothetical protein
MKTAKFVALILCSFSLTWVWADTDCTSGRTTIVVKDCDNVPVSGAQVEIKVCCGEGRTVSNTTDKEGKASFNVYRKDICGRKINLAGFATNQGELGGCSGDDKDATCEVQICAPR